MSDEIVFSPEVKDTINRLRRSINDLEEERDFTDQILYEYLQDAVDELEMGDYKKGRYINTGEFYNSKNIIEWVPNTERMLYSVKAHILMKTGIKDKADRDNFLLRKNKLTIDTSSQSDDHEKTISILNERLNKMLYQLKHSPISGVRVE